MLDVLLAVRMTSLDRLDPVTHKIVSSKSFLAISKIQKLNDTKDCFIVYFNNNKSQQYWCYQRETLIETICTNLRKTTGEEIHVTTEETSWEFESLFATRDSAGKPKCRKYAVPTAVVI